MTDLTLTKTRIQAGVYEGVIMSEGTDAPEVKALHQDAEVGELSITADGSLERTWHLRLQLPPHLMTDGMQTILLVNPTTNETLDIFTIVTGEPLDENMRGEIDLLRAELDLLKKAFRRHCVETM